MSYVASVLAGLASTISWSARFAKNFSLLIWVGGKIANIEIGMIKVQFKLFDDFVNLQKYVFNLDVKRLRYIRDSKVDHLADAEYKMFKDNDKEKSQRKNVPVCLIWILTKY